MRHFLTAICLLTLQSVIAQDIISDHHAEVLRQQQLKNYPVEKWDSLRCAWYGDCARKSRVPSLAQQQTCNLTKRFFGWHAIGTSSSSYQWSLLSDLSYFSYQVTPATGDAANAAQLVNWGNNATVLAAKANGVRVSLCVTLFNNGTEFSTFFNSPTAPANLVTKLVSEVVTAGADGINIDFEGSGLTSTYLNAFISFMSNLNAQLDAAKPGAEISIDLQGSMASAGTMHTQLLPYVDWFILMGYDYYWGTQKYPGPIGPTYQFPPAAGDPFGHGNVSNDVNHLLRFVPSSKVILAMPYYGRRWKTTSGCTIPATGDANSLSVQTYTQFRDNTNGYYSNTLRDNYSFNAYHCFTDVNGVANQQFIDDSISLQKKYDLVWQRSLGGAAVWRLGYDAGYADCWNLVARNLTGCNYTPASYTLYDMGGPLNNYVNNSRYTFSVLPTNADYLQLSFNTLDIEQGYDSLWLYNGADTTAPLIAAYSGNSVPAPMVASSGKLTVRFKSDGATTKPGYTLQYASASGPLVFRSVQSGSWHNASTWSTATVPSVYDSVIISAGHTVQVNTNAFAKNVAVEPGGAVQLANNVKLDIRKPE